MNELLSIKEAAKLLGVTEKTLREWDHSGKLKPQRTIGGHRRYNLQDIRKSTAEKSFFDSFSERDRTQNYRDIQIIHKYWVDKLPDELKQDSSLSVMLENYMLLNATTDDIGVPSEDMISLIIAVWGKMEMRQFISTQAALGPETFMPQYSIIAGVRRKPSNYTPSDKFVFCPYIFLQPAIDVASFSAWITRVGFYYPPESHPDFEVFCYED